MQRLMAINPSAAEGRARELLERVQQKLGVAPNIVRTMANSPAVLEGYLNLAGSLDKGILPAKLREQIAIVVGETNGCDYRVAAHTTIGKMAGLIARSVVVSRGRVRDHEFDYLRIMGFTDKEIAEFVGNVALNLFTNYFNYVAETIVDFPKAPDLASASARQISPNRSRLGGLINMKRWASPFQVFIVCLMMSAWLLLGCSMGMDKKMDKPMMEKPDGTMMKKKPGMEGKQESMMGAGPRQAALVGAAGHHAAGTAVLAKDGAGKPSLTFSNLDVDRVPDGRVYLAKHGDHAKGIEVGRLTVFQGVVTFMIPEGANPDEYDGVVIWCEKFGVEIGHGTFIDGTNKGM